MDPRNINLEAEHGVNLIDPSKNKWLELENSSKPHEYDEFQSNINKVFRNVVFECFGCNVGYKVDFAQILVDGVRFALFAYTRTNKVSYVYYKEDNGEFTRQSNYDMFSKYEKVCIVGAYFYWHCG